jgi:hypothetical protein
MKKKSNQLLGLIVLVVGTFVVSYGQGQKDDLCIKQPNSLPCQFKAKFVKLRDEIVAIKNSGDSAAGQDTQIRQKFAATNQLDLIGFALVMAKQPRSAYVTAIENARIDKQVGGGSSSSGSTSLAAKASVPSILGLAVENGALQKDISGTTITFRGNPVGIIKALGDNGFIESYDDDDPTTRFLRRLSFSTSFDTDRGPQPGNFLGSKQQLSAYSFRFDIYNKRDPRHSTYREKWAKLITGPGLAFTQDLSRLKSYFNPATNPDPNVMAWLTASQDAIVAASAADVERVLEDVLGDKLRAVQLPQQVKAAVDSFEANVNSYLGDRANLLQEVANGPIVTFEYTNNRPGNQPNYSNFNIIGEFSPFNGQADLTTNASFSTFSTKPIGVTRTARDFQLSGQLDIPFNPSAGPFVFTMSGKYQHVFSDITTTGTTPTTLQKGNIGIGQFKFTIPVKGSGVKIPLSVTFSNRTEFIKESKVRGNIGVTFDLDALFSKLKP